MTRAPLVTRRLLAAAATAAALTTAAPVTPASAYVCGGVQYCLCPLLSIGCATPQRCFDVWGGIVCI